MADKRLPGLDALRGVAALCVLVYHLPEYGIVRILPHGYLAVDFFFMLSGYVMARTYEARFAGDLNASRFLAKRYRRLWPVAALGMAIALPMLAGYPPATQLAFGGASLLLIPVFWSGYLFPSNVAAWSILFELVANGCHAGLLWRWRGRILALAAALALASLAAVAAIYGNLDVGASGPTLFAGVPRVAWAYIAGVLVWRRFGDTPPVRLPPAVVLLAMPVLLLASGGWAFDIVFVTLVCPLLLIAGIRSPAPRALLFAGAISYPLYALQIPVLDVGRMAGLPWFVSVGIALALASATALRPATRLRRLVVARLVRPA